MGSRCRPYLRARRERRSKPEPVVRPVLRAVRVRWAVGWAGASGPRGSVADAPEWGSPAIGRGRSESRARTPRRVPDRPNIGTAAFRAARPGGRREVAGRSSSRRPHPGPPTVAHGVRPSAAARFGDTRQGIRGAGHFRRTGRTGSAPNRRRRWLRQPRGCAARARPAHYGLRGSRAPTAGDGRSRRRTSWRCSRRAPPVRRPERAYGQGLSMRRAKL